MLSWCEPGIEHSYLFGFVSLYLVENHEGFLGYYSFIPQPLRDMFLLWGSGLLIVILLAFAYARRQRFLQAALLLLIASGATGNLTDRLVNDGGVIDFIVLGPAFFTTGIFNIADLFILAGSCGLGYTLSRS